MLVTNARTLSQFIIEESKIRYILPSGTGSKVVLKATARDITIVETVVEAIALATEPMLLITGLDGVQKAILYKDVRVINTTESGGISIAYDSPQFRTDIATETLTEINAQITAATGGGGGGGALTPIAYFQNTNFDPGSNTLKVKISETLTDIEAGDYLIVSRMQVKALNDGFVKNVVNNDGEIGFIADKFVASEQQVKELTYTRPVTFNSPAATWLLEQYVEGLSNISGVPTPLAIFYAYYFGSITVYKIN
jgi:hypothetical protein